MQAMWHGVCYYNHPEAFSWWASISMAKRSPHISQAARSESKQLKHWNQPPSRGWNNFTIHTYLAIFKWVKKYATTKTLCKTFAWYVTQELCTNVRWWYSGLPANKNNIHRIDGTRACPLIHNHKFGGIRACPLNYSVQHNFFLFFGIMQRSVLELWWNWIFKLALFASFEAHNLRRHFCAQSQCRCIARHPSEMCTNGTTDNNWSRILRSHIAKYLPSSIPIHKLDIYTDGRSCCILRIHRSGKPLLYLLRVVDKAISFLVRLCG